MSVLSLFVVLISAAGAFGGVLRLNHQVREGERGGGGGKKKERQAAHAIGSYLLNGLLSLLLLLLHLLRFLLLVQVALPRGAAVDICDGRVLKLRGDRSLEEEEEGEGFRNTTRGE